MYSGVINGVLVFRFTVSWFSNAQPALSFCPITPDAHVQVIQSRTARTYATQIVGKDNATG